MTNISHAATDGFTELANSPSITIAKPSNKKLEAIKITIKAPATSQLNAVRIYNKEKSTMDNNDILSTKFIANSSKMSGNYYTQMVYKIPKSALPKKNKTQVITIIARANNMEKTRKVVSVTNKDGKYYVLNNAPNITGIQYTNNNVEISMKSTGQEIKSIEVIDTNNSKSVYSSNKLADVKINKGKLSLKNDEYYRIRIKVKDKNGAYTAKNVAFKLPADVEVKDDTNVTEIPCTHENVKYKTTATQHTKICKDCGKTLGKEYHIFGGYDNDNDNYQYTATGKCKVCGYECKHKDTSYSYTSGWHTKFCNTCGKMWAGEKHNVKNGQCTICKISDSTLGTVYYKDDYNNTNYMDNISPGITTLKSNSKLDDIKIKVRIKDGSATVKIYETDSQGKNRKELNITKSKESSSDYDIYVLSHKDLLKGGTHYFYITAKNKYGTSTRYYQIKKASKIENNKTINYYAINASPKINCLSTNFSLSNYKFTVTDNSGLGSIKITDMNNNGKQVYSYTAKTTKSTQKIITLDIENKFKAKNGVYKFKVEMKDKSNEDKVSTRVITIDTKTSGWHKVTSIL